MAPAWSKLELDIAELDTERLLDDWRWLVPDQYAPLAMTVFGDWFLEGPDGQVLMLDLVAGDLKPIAADRDQFYGARTTRENLDAWYMAELAYLCYERGIQPGPGQCLSYRIPPVLGGELVPGNIEVTDIGVHQSLMAQIHHGVRDLPEGTRIDRITIDGEEP